MWEYSYTNEMYHHGILGMHWGIRRYQNPDGTLTEAGRRRLDRKDNKWAKKNYNKIVNTTKKKVARELNEYSKELLRDPSARNSNGKISAAAINKYNRRMADLMNQNVDSIAAPSGRVVKFVAKRGEVGVHLALADRAYDINQLKNGVWSSGRIAYRKKAVDVM